MHLERGEIVPGALDPGGGEGVANPAQQPGGAHQITLDAPATGGEPPGTVEVGSHQILGLLGDR